LLPVKRCCIQEQVSGGHYYGQLPVSPAYNRIDAMLEGGGRVLLDGGIATELQRVRSEDRARRREPWGTWALFRGPMEVLEVHRRYVASGCDLISTNTWSVLEAADESTGDSASPGGTPLWLDAARIGLRLARQAIAEAGGDGERATAFCINSSLADERASGRLELLSWMWSEEPPDLVILETLETIPDEDGLRTIEMLCETGLPVWVSFRRRKEGMSTADGDVVPDDDSAAFGHALNRMRDVGVGAALVNCVPPGHLDETMRWLSEQSPLPIGCYPNLGHSAGSHWEFDSAVGPDDYARLAESWIAAGARIVGGCCGVTPEHIAALRELVMSFSERPAALDAGS
jgi:S-methylmethionine-dependent homocysteine/selenocysteine methylase